MRLLRRVLLAMGVGSIIAAILRLLSPGEVPLSEGKWRELRGPDLR